MVLIARPAAKNTLMKIKRQKNGTQKITFALFAEKNLCMEMKNSVYFADKNIMIFNRVIESAIELDPTKDMQKGQDAYMQNESLRDFALDVEKLNHNLAT